MSRLAVLLLASFLTWQPVQAKPASHGVTQDNVGVAFSIRYLLIAKATGRFTDVAGSYSFDPQADELGAIDVTIGTGSVDTGSPGRDRDLAGEDFFWTDRYPTMHFISRHAVRTGPHAGRVEGDLTLRGVTRPVVLLVAMGDHAATATTSVKRSEFGMRPGLAGLVIADKVDIRIEIRGLPDGTAPAGAAPPPPA